MLSIIELMRLNRRELLEIESECNSALNERSEECPERSIVMTNLQNIRYVINRPHVAP
jgi:hypothetical protein